MSISLLAEEAPIELEVFSDSLIRFSIIAVVTLVAGAVLIVALTSLLRRSVERRGLLPPEELQRWRTALIDYVRDASQTQGAPVGLRRFWAKKAETKLSNAQKAVVLKDLLERQVLYPVYSDESLVAFAQRVRWDFVHRAVTHVRLSDQDWHRHATGAPAGISASGDVILVRDSPGTGVVSRSHDVSQRVAQGVTPAHVQELVRALRQDAHQLAQGDRRREQAESFADTLERDLATDRWESVRKTVGDVVEFTARGVTLWAATLAVLGAV